MKNRTGFPSITVIEIMKSKINRVLRPLESSDLVMKVAEDTE